MMTARTKRHLRTKQAILDAARAIIAAEGPAMLSMRALADRIDYSAAGLYEYFGSKEEIIAAVCDQGQQYLFEAMSEVDPTLPPAEHLYQIGQAYIRFALAHPDYFLLMFTGARQEMADLLPDAVQEQMVAKSAAYGILAHTIQRGIEDGTFPVRPDFGHDEMTYAAWTTVHGIAMLRTTALRSCPVDLAPADHQALHNFLRGLQAA